MLKNPLLTRYWFITNDIEGYDPGFGVTGYCREDAEALLKRSQNLDIANWRRRQLNLSEIKITGLIENVDIGSLMESMILPNSLGRIAIPIFRSVWYRCQNIMDN